MNGLVHAFRGAGLGAAKDTIIFDTVLCMRDLAHTFRDAGLGAVTSIIIFDTVRSDTKESHSTNRQPDPHL